MDYIYFLLVLNAILKLSHFVAYGRTIMLSFRDIRTQSAKVSVPSLNKQAIPIQCLDINKERIESTNTSNALELLQNNRKCIYLYKYNLRLWNVEVIMLQNNCQMSSWGWTVSHMCYYFYKEDMQSSIINKTPAFCVFISF